MTHAEANAELDRLLRLDDDWDGAGSLPPSPVAIITAREALGGISAGCLPARIVPTVNAGVDFEWLDAYRVGRIARFYWDGQSDSWEMT